MPSADPLLMSFLGAGLVLLLVLSLAAWRVGSRLSRIENLLAARKSQTDAPAASARRQTVADAPAEGAFTEFLAENPAALEMSRREQAEAYRKWRKGKGLTWAAR